MKLRTSSGFKACLRLATSAVGVLLATLAAAAGFDAELGLRHEDNVTRAQADADREHDTALVLGVHGFESWRLDPLTTFSVEAGLGGRWWTRFEDVSRFSAELGVRARRRLGIDFGAPWAELALGVTGLKHVDSAVRDGGIARAGLTVGKRFGHRWHARAGYGYAVRRAVEDVVFDTEQHEVFGQLDLSLGSRWLVYAEIGAIEGELTSVASLPNPKIRRAANAVMRDFDAAYGEGRSPLVAGPRPRWTYQLDGVVVSGELGVNYPLGHGVALDVAARWVEARAAGDNDYDGYIVNAGLLWRFD